MAIFELAFATAVRNLRAGQLEVAERELRSIVASDEHHADAWYMLGVTAFQRKDYSAAQACFEKAITENPVLADAHRALGLCHRMARRPHAAVVCARRTLELQPTRIDALEDLALALLAQEAFAEAESAFRRLLVIRPDAAELHNALGNALAAQKRFADAGTYYERALALNPNYPEAASNLGNIHLELGDFSKASASYGLALRLRPKYLAARVNLGIAELQQGRPADARPILEEAVADAPTNIEALHALGSTLRALGELDPAEDRFRRILETCPDHPAAGVELGNVLKDQGRVDEAVGAFRHVISRHPQHVEAHSNLLYTLLFCPHVDAETLAVEHACWKARHAEPLRPKLRPAPHEPNPDRRLRIGYVSPDFTAHPVGRFLLPLVEQHDRNEFEVFCYSSVRRPDAYTEKFKSRAEVWRDCLRLSDAQLAETIRADRIDILVDLSLHTAHHRLLVFARQPAPVQVSYLAYCGTSGMPAMDYRLTDPYLDPPGSATWSVETPVVLPESYWCYRPPFDIPKENASAARHPGPLTFGCFNNFCKVNERVLAVWGQLLASVPASRLLLHAPITRHRQRVVDSLRSFRITPDRIEFHTTLTLSDYFSQYRKVDIALDPFPYGGGTTTCDALWMGVPVVTLAGPQPQSRSGLSILSNVGLGHLAASDEDAYLRIALDFAMSSERLQALRTDLRTRLPTAPLTDIQRACGHLERVYRSVWQRCCVSASVRGGSKK